MFKLLFQVLVKNLPWVLILVLISWIFFARNIPFFNQSREMQINEKHDLLLTSIETIGKIELVRYNFKEVTELKGISKWKLFFRSYNPDMKAMLISSGEAVGCIDLAKLKKEDIQQQGDSVIIYMPEPEICYYKVDLENSRIYDLETGYLSTDEEERQFVEKAYQSAEQQIRKAAYAQGIQEQTRLNAQKVLKPLLSEIAGGPVILLFEPKIQSLESY